MASRYSRNRQKKQLAKALARVADAQAMLAEAKKLSDRQKIAEGRRLLIACDREARRRAGDLKAPAVWGLADPPTKELCDALDPTGELWDLFKRICAESLPRASGIAMLGGGYNHQRVEERKLAEDDMEPYLLVPPLVRKRRLHEIGAQDGQRAPRMKVLQKKIEFRSAKEAEDMLFGGRK